MKSKPTDISELMGQKLSQVQQRTHALQQLEQSVRQVLGDDLQGRYRVANLRQGVLVIETNSGAWATRLQFQKQQLLQHLRQQNYPMLTTIEIKVNPKLSRVERHQEKNLNSISPEAAKGLNELAETVGGSLGEKLKKLAALGGRPIK
ncbi:DUF721 domain-containing protein [Ferrimonas aestuarii]|uniref:DUF721 domain-containing protein n=1 Tax=Ferrimonas aestuarii TaxID=2569539 RepID=A0A4U1BLP8_9GAMM|nr:DciA family protein [Ferrimonas aestuarii]TKB53720.1 DUF721 domain-containing protein [Ferrimonas aestuarii]